MGVSLGMVLSVAVMKAMQGFGLSSFAFPGGWLGVVILASPILLGTGGRRSARPGGPRSLSILDAIATE